jgi:CDP-diacylglycerol--serine O-phosphatidyltransferase
MRRAIVILPGAFTSGNLFFGVWAIIEAARGDFLRASYFVVLAGIMDMLDGRIARMSRTGSAFGAEMDSLVDAISFGVAPALLVYFHTFRSGEWAWLLCFLYILAVVLRLARFNVEQAGHAKSQFFGLPSPAAGMMLATFWPFSQTPLYQRYLADPIPEPLFLAVLMVVSSLVMVSHVPYPIWPRVGVRSWRGLLGWAYSLGVLAAMLYIPAYFFFPYGLAYLGFGLGRAVLAGLSDRMPERDPLRDEDDEAPRGADRGAPATLPFQLGRHRRRPGGPLP